MMLEPLDRLALPGLGSAASAGTATALGRSWWIAGTTLAIVIAWIVGWYWNTGATMVGIWTRSETFAHGFAVPRVPAWLVGRARGTLAARAPRPSWWVLAPICAAGAGWLLGELGTVNALSQFSFVALIVLAVPAVLGTQVARLIAFPLAFLFFAVPVGEFMMPKLMEWTADVTVRALQITGIPVFREGQSFIIPSGKWSVVEACSGVRYLIASLVVGTLYAYLSYRTLLRRLVFIGFSILVPIVANWIRAYTIVMIGHLSGNRYAVGVDHLIYGWVFFGAVILIMFWIGGHWRDDLDADAAARAAAPVSRVNSPAEFLLVAAIAAVVTAAWPIAYGTIDRINVASPAALPVLGAAGPWSASAERLAAWQPRFQRPSAELQQTFSRGGAPVGVYVGYYRDQSPERKLVNSENVLVASDDHVWSRVASGTRSIVVDGRPVEAKTAVLKDSLGDVLVVWYWYWIDGRVTASDSVAKAYTAISRLLGHGDDGAIVAVYARNAEAGAADAALDAFVREMGPDVAALLERARSRR